MSISIDHGHLFLKKLEANQTFEGIYLVRSKNLSVGKTGKPYLTVVLSDRSGVMDGRVWDQADEINSVFEPDDFVKVSGLVQLYQGRRQLVIRGLEKVDHVGLDPALYLPTTSRDIESMFQELLGLLKSIPNPNIQWLALEILNHPEIGPAFKRAPAARTVHHAWVGGLLEHTLNVVKLAKFLCGFYPMVDPSYLLFGAAFHDFGKALELSVAQGFSYTLEGRLVGHLVSGAHWVEKLAASRSDFPKEELLVCQHLILSHHGKLEYGSPKLPSTLEAVIVGIIDNLDSRVQGIVTFMEQEDLKPGTWSGRHSAFENYFYCPENSSLSAWLKAKKTSS